MKRRDFLFASLAAGLPWSLGGCVINPTTIRKALPSIEGWAGGEGLAREIIQAAQGGGFANKAGIPYAAVTQRNEWLKARTAFSKMGAPTFSDAYALSEASVRYFGVVVAATQSAKNKGLAGLGNSPATGILIHPGQSITFQERGFCLDPKLPAPGKGELLRLVPTSTAMDTKILPVYEAVLKQAARKDRTGEMYREHMQRMVWMFRTVGEESPYITYANDKAKQLINQAYPNGWKTLEQHHQSQQVMNKAISALKSELGKSLKLPLNLKPEDLLDDRLGNRIIEEQLRQLMNTPVKGEIREGSQYSLLAPGVAAEVVGSGPLTAHFRITNLSGKPFVYSPTAWSAQSTRRSQRVAFSGNIRNLQRQNAVDPAGDDWQRQFNAQAREDWSKFGMEKFLALTNSDIGRLIGSAKAPGFKLLLDSVPFLGNTLSLYEAVSGKDWMTGEELDGVDLGLAILGTIPGIATLSRMGSAATGTVKAVLAAAEASKAVRVVDRNQLALDLVNIANTESTKSLVERNLSDERFQEVRARAERIFSL